MQRRFFRSFRRLFVPSSVSALFALASACGPEISATAASDAASAAEQGLSSPPAGASIITPSGKVFSLAGSAKLAATNAWLQSQGEHFVAGYPAGFPASYWGINSATEAYVFLNAQSYPSSRWTTKTGGVIDTPYRVFSVRIMGFRTNAAGQPVDVSGDGVVNDADWVAFEPRGLTGLDGDTATASLVSFYAQVFGQVAQSAGVIVGGVDAQGYPTTTDYKYATSFTLGANNPYRCTPASEMWQQCWYFDDQVYSGASHDQYPAAWDVSARWTFRHFGNNWVKYKSTTDRFTLSTGPLKTALTTIGFKPRFFVRATDSSFDLPL